MKIYLLWGDAKVLRAYKDKDTVKNECKRLSSLRSEYYSEWLSITKDDSKDPSEKLKALINLGYNKEIQDTSTFYYSVVDIVE